MSDEKRTVAVLGLDEHNQEVLDRLPDADRYRFLPLLTIDELQYGDEIPVLDLLAKAKAELDAAGPVHGVIGFWDFPVSTMLPFLCAHAGTPGPSLDAVLRCEHKYWSRLEQQAVLDDEYPVFALVDPDRDTEPPENVPFPMWVKPIKAFSSDLAFRVTDAEGFHDALTRIAEDIGRVGEPFSDLMALDHPPPELAEWGGRTCVVEEAVEGQQVTLEGWARDGELHVLGVVDTVNRSDVPSQDRFVYPSTVPSSVVERMASVTGKIVRRIGLDHTTVNVEFFWNPDADRLTVLEVNPRHSQSHAELFADVDGAANHLAMVRLAVGEDPAMPRREGRHAMAAKWFLRRFDDGVARRVPTVAEVAEVTRAVPGVTVDVIVNTGERLSELPDQDSYSYKIANIYVGGSDEQELADRFHRCAEALPFEFDE
ncbi:acetyl-CoA carboxylase biotin carboxylase subunit family protein [Pseudonocardia nantongensis]|uniref:ATP-grasp domain-containing protein n=1 Tax=Pseudonocardia nantongensis TaxID=1181885 RepID=UPI00397BC681